MISIELSDFSYIEQSNEKNEKTKRKECKGENIEGRERER